MISTRQIDRPVKFLRFGKFQLFPSTFFNGYLIQLFLFQKNYHGNNSKRQNKKSLRKVDLDLGSSLSNIYSREVVQ